VVVARRVAARLDLGAGAEQAVAGLVGDAELLPAAARRLDSLGEEAVLQLAVHLRSSEQANALFLLAQADDPEPWERERLRELHELLQAALAHPELTGREAANAVEQRKATARRLTQDRAVQERIVAAPRAYVLATAPADLARHAALCEPPPRGDDVRVRVEAAAGGGELRVDVVSRDRIGLLAAETLVLAEAGVDVLEATVATWGDGCALASFRTAAAVAPDAGALEGELRATLGTPAPAPPIPDATVAFDDAGSPWHTLCRVEAPDRPRLLYAITSAFAASGASVHLARVTTVGHVAVDHFELTDRNGHKLNEPVEAAIRSNLGTGVSPSRRRWAPWRRVLSAPPGNHDGHRQSTKRKHFGDHPETTAP
jgi:[protein-PII] uridylyltransferase